MDPACTNPFEEYDETKNPFADDDDDDGGGGGGDDGDDSLNPFNADDDAVDYDKHLNPFA